MAGLLVEPCFVKVIISEWDGKKKDVRRHDSSPVVFAGPERIARKLIERLTSSAALADDERRKSSDRRQKRDADYLAAANAEKDQVPMSAA